MSIGVASATITEETPTSEKYVTWPGKASMIAAHTIPVRATNGKSAFVAR